MPSPTDGPPFWADRSDRARLAITGPDRAKFLHNLTTNDVKRLAIGHGHESFVTSPQGKTLGYVTLLAEPERILLRTDPGGLSHVLPHLTKYGIFDEVGIEDVGPSTFEIHVVGADVARLLEGPPPDGLYRNAPVRLGGVTLLGVNEDPTGRPGLTLIGASADKGAVVSALDGMTPIDAEAFEALRVEAGTPAFGADVTVDNLPQEVGRDPRAISFVKGCYLGQETVARIDALGHVNKILRPILLEGAAVPPRGAAVEAGGKPAGLVTSSAYSSGRGQAVALAYVRVAHAEPGTALNVAGVEPGEWEAATVGDPPRLP